MAIISVIIPLHTTETEWEQLIEPLSKFPVARTEIIFTVSNYHRTKIDTDSRHRVLPKILDDVFKLLRLHNIRWLVCKEDGRAAQMNEAASIANGDYIWFLHADSLITQENIKSILKVVEEGKNYLYYFDLKFYSGSRLMVVNALCVWLRCRLCGLPFGDQAFVISKDVFHQLGGYNCKAEYGEDHLLVWQAKQLGIPVVPIGSFISTSARKYSQNGWHQTTSRHFRMFIKQALPEYKKYKTGK